MPKAKTQTKPKTAKKPTAKKVAQTAPKKAALQPANLLEFGSVPPYRSKKGEKYMNAGMTGHFHQILENWKTDLREEVDRTVHHMQTEVERCPDPSDRATQEEEISLELRTRDRERKLIKKIDKSLDAIDLGEYGYCEACGLEIGLRRLEARPTANLCIDCKVLDEIREKQEGN